MVLFGVLLALGNQDNRNMMMAFSYLCQFGYGWSLTLSFAFIQLGVDQVELGVAGALAYVEGWHISPPFHLLTLICSGAGRWTGGSIASSVYTTILTNKLSSESAKNIPQAAAVAGLALTELPSVFAALPLGLKPLQEIPGMKSDAAALIWKAWQDSYIVAIRQVTFPQTVKPPIPDKFDIGMSVWLHWVSASSL